MISGNNSNNSNPQNTCTVDGQNQLSLKENCFDTYDDSQYLDKCNLYIEVWRNF